MGRREGRTIAGLIVLIGGIVTKHNVFFTNDGSPVSSTILHVLCDLLIMVLVVVYLLLGATVLCVLFQHIVNFIHIFVIWLFVCRILISWSVMSATPWTNDAPTIFVRQKLDAIHINLLRVMLIYWWFSSA